MSNSRGMEYTFVEEKEQIEELKEKVALLESLLLEALKKINDLNKSPNVPYIPPYQPPYKEPYDWEPRPYQPWITYTFDCKTDNKLTLNSQLV